MVLFSNKPLRLPFLVLALFLTCMIGIWGTSMVLHSDIIITPSTIDLGRVLKGVHTATFHVVNNSSHNIELYIKSKSCSCTTANIENAKLKPGQSTKLELTIHSGERVGEMFSQVTIACKDSPNTKQRIATARLIPESIATVTPAHLNLGYLDTDKSTIDTRFEISKGKSSVDWSTIVAKSKYFGELKTLNDSI